MQLLLIDAIGPFFRGLTKRRINWSKIPFQHLDELVGGEDREAQWQQIYDECRELGRQVSEMGYTAVTLDDMGHLVEHPLMEEEIARKNESRRGRFQEVIQIFRRYGLEVYLTSDVVTLSPAMEEAVGDDRAALTRCYCEMVRTTFRVLPDIAGLILRIGESDGVDVSDPIRSKLHLKTASQTNAFLKEVLPLFEMAEKTLILRTWTVGAHAIGDLIWHRQRLSQAFSGISSDKFFVSMKHGESDFFRYLPINRAFLQLEQKKIIELQGRREYEGAGEYPSFIGYECERFARELVGVKGLVGMSMWCQTGGWHRFSRRPFVGSDEDIWVRLNCMAAVCVFRDGQTARDAVVGVMGDRAEATIQLLNNTELVIESLLYIQEFARMKLFFRRVRIPPLLHVYWDCIFVSGSVRKLMRTLVTDHEAALNEGEVALELFPNMLDQAERAGLPVRDVEFMRDSFSLIAAARRYYFLSYDESLVDQIGVLKKAYKERWPKDQGARYRVKIDPKPMRVRRRTLRWAMALMLRKKRGYRLVDHVFTLSLLSLSYKLFKKRYTKAFPKFVRKSAMGVDSLFD